MFENPIVNPSALCNSCAEIACCSSELIFTFLRVGCSIQYASEQLFRYPPFSHKPRSSSNPASKNLTNSNSSTSVIIQNQKQVHTNLFPFSRWLILFTTENNGPSSCITPYSSSSMQISNGLENVGVRVRKQTEPNDVSHYSSGSKNVCSRTSFGFEK
jgi:hypothetical protein